MTKFVAILLREALELALEALNPNNSIDWEEKPFTFIH
jgi:hypothetical protein